MGKGFVEIPVDEQSPIAGGTPRADYQATDKNGVPQQPGLAGAAAPAIVDGELKTKKALKQFSDTATPFVLSRFVGVASDFVAAIFLSRLNKNALAASGWVTVINSCMIITSFLAIYATGALAKGAIGAKKFSRVGSVLKNSYLFSFGVASAVAVLTAFTDRILIGIGQNPEIAKLAQNYYRAFSYGGVHATLMSVSSQQICYAIKKPWLVLKVNLVRRAIYLILAWGLIFGKAGLPQLGFAGLAFARTASSLFDQIFFMYYLKRKAWHSIANYEQYGIDPLFFLSREGWSNACEGIGEFLHKAFKMWLGALAKFAGNIAGITFLGWLSDALLAAGEIGVQYFNLLNVVVLTFQQANFIVSNGLNKAKRAIDAAFMGNQALKVTMGFLAVASVVLAVGSWGISSAPLIKLFEHEEHSPLVTQTAEKLIGFVLGRQFFNIINEIRGASQRAFGDFDSSTIANFIGQTLVGGGLAYALSGPLGLGAQGVFAAWTAGVAVSAIYSECVWRGIVKKQVTPAASIVTSASPSGPIQRGSPTESLLRPSDVPPVTFAHAAMTPAANAPYQPVAMVPGQQQA